MNYSSISAISQVLIIILNKMFDGFCFFLGMTVRRDGGHLDLGFGLGSISEGLLTILRQTSRNSIPTGFT
jgi:hypothetical protein